MQHIVMTHSFSHKQILTYTWTQLFRLSQNIIIIINMPKERNITFLEVNDLGNIFIQVIIEWIKMAPRMAAVLRAPGKLCSFSYVLFVFLLFHVLDVVSITVYDRDTLLNIGSSVAQRKPDFAFLNAGGLFTDTVRVLCVGCEIEETPPTPKKRKKSWRSRQTEMPCFPTSSSNHFTGQRSVTG